MKTAAQKRLSHVTGYSYWACLHDPTNVSSPTCSFFDPLPAGHPFAGFCRFNMARQDSRDANDFTDLCYSSRAVAAIEETTP
jgi:hypothetical protein